MPSLIWKAAEHGARGDGLADDDVIPGQHLAAGRRSRCGRGAGAWGGSSRPSYRPRGSRPCVPARSSPAARAALAISQASTTTSLRAREAPAETAARHQHVDHDLFGRQAENFRRRAGIEPGALAAHPDLGTIVCKPDRAVQGLHRRVREIGEDELGLESAGAPSPAAPCRRRTCAGRAGRRARDTGRAAFRCRPSRQLGGVPFQLQGIAPLRAPASSHRPLRPRLRRRRPAAPAGRPSRP